MENIKKEKDIAFVLDTRTISQKKSHFILKATKKQCQELANFYELPNVCNLTVDFYTSLKDDIIIVNGILDADVNYVCVVTNESFDNHIHQPFTLLFSEDENVIKIQENKTDFSPDEEFIDFIENGRIYFFNIVREQLGLMLDPFPKKTNKTFTYYEEKTTNQKENPFSILKHLTK